ncbi:general secretion pathway protein GspB [Venatoribacter cucullus]|uniref:general secretion pathway protein GspB n=1 Tax=Venatoribacter cucullus TaxID=2661630 RepID=UPI00223F36F6|nr:general secretion pathway protein GspB [Venatoribacter cucullus]UZK03739.1 hypothetical protein GAY96_07450 [Venatoribacter cucullus]
MSYILDALKKSEQQRASAQPLPAAVSLPVATAPAWSALPGALVVLALLLSLLLIWWWPESATELAPQTVTATPPAPVAEPQTVLNSAEVADMPETRLPEAPPPVWVTADPSVTNEPAAVPELQPALPADSRLAELRPVEARVETRRLPPLQSLRRIPALMINSHIYSPLADKRSVTINNRAWREGEPLAEGIVLQEITPQGIVLDVDGWPLPVNRQQGWQPVPQ